MRTKGMVGRSPSGGRGTPNERGPVAGPREWIGGRARMLARAASPRLEPLPALAAREQGVQVGVDLGAHDLGEDLTHAALDLGPELVADVADRAATTLRRRAAPAGGAGLLAPRVVGDRRDAI